jgi:hypothetical protein
LARRTEGRWNRRLSDAALFGAGALILVLPWQIVGRLQPDDGANQDIFVQYFLFADGAHATWRTWFQSRWDNFAHTFIPGYLLTADPTHESLNSAYGRSDRWVQASFLYWNTLPLALGLPAFCLAAIAIAQAVWRAFGVTFLTLIAPALFLVVYWGAASTGLMRQCGHALFFSVITVAVWSCATWPRTWSRRAMRIFLHPACYAWRGVDVAMMAFGTTLLNRQPDFAGLFGWNDVLSISCAGALLVWTVAVVARATPLPVGIGESKE